MVLDMFCKRVGIDKPLKADKKSLEYILRKSSQNIPFENLNVHLDKGIDLSHDRIVNKILKEKRGGNCYEVNGMLSFVLEEIGFKVSYLGARTIFG